MDHPYVLITEYPYSWREGWTAFFDSEQERRDYADELRSETNSVPDTEDYLRIRFATLTEEA